jgi:hypothetical protein
MTALGVLSNDRSHTFRQAIESAAHVRRFAGHPDPCSLRTIHRLQTWQPDHSAASTTTNNARTCSASNPGLTIRLRPFLSRISTLESPGVLGPCPATCTSRNFVGVSSSSRFFHTKKYGRHKPCSRQNAFTLCPLRACSEISLRHFIQAFFERLVMSQHCNATRIFTRWGSLSAHTRFTLEVCLTTRKLASRATAITTNIPRIAPLGVPSFFARAFGDFSET